MKRRLLATIGLCLAFCLAGGSTAMAWTWGTTSAPQSVMYNKVSRGDARGQTYRSGYNKILTTGAIRDRLNNGWSIFQESRSWKPAQPGTTIASVQTNRISKSTWTNFNTTTLTSWGSSVGYYSSSKVCEDAPWRPDICSTTKSHAL